ncbi:Protein R10E12.2 [Aphelenchoides avenae]|nr:Protein R10E12.2 [Aphelenchus avenae]
MDLLWLLLILQLCLIQPVSSTNRDTKPFWLSTEVLHVEFKKNCLTTAFCHESRFTLSNSMLTTKEKSTVSWPAEELTEDQKRSFVTYWTNGEPEDLVVSAQIAGTDPSFGFSRVCDETPAKRPFNDIAAVSLTSRSRRNEHSDDEGRMLVEMRGRCFNATLAVRKHMTRCPWCPDPNLQISVTGQQVGDFDADSEMGFFERLVGANSDSFVVIVALSGITVTLSVLLCVLFAMHMRQRRRKQYRSGKPRPQQFLYHQQRATLPPPTMYQIAEPLKGCHSDQRDEQRYETPWESKYRPIPYWLTQGGTATRLPAAMNGTMDAHPELSGGRTIIPQGQDGTYGSKRLSSQNTSTSGMKSPTTTLDATGRPFQLSPNSTSSMGRHDDSGLESV